MAKLTANAIYGMVNASIVSKEQGTLAEHLIIALLEQKRRNHHMMDDKAQAKALKANPELLDSIGYEEDVVFGTHVTNIRSRFRELAKKYGLTRMGNQGDEVVGDTLFVDYLAYKSQLWFHSGADKTGLKMPTFAIMGGGRKTTFFLAEKAAHMGKSVKMSNDNIIATLRRDGKTIAIKTYDPTVKAIAASDRAETEPALSQEAMDALAKNRAEAEEAKLRKEMEKLVAENAALKARQFVEVSTNGTSESVH